MSKAHKHAEVIKAWADGQPIEMRYVAGGTWEPLLCDAPHWDAPEYRVKPERIYPVTLMTATEVRDVFNNCGAMPDGLDWVEIANVALRHAIDAGQVVTAEGHANEVADIHRLWTTAIAEMHKEREARDMAVAKEVQGACFHMDARDIDLVDIICGVRA